MKRIVMTILLTLFTAFSINSQHKKLDIKKNPDVSVKQLAAVIGLLKTFAPPAYRLGQFRNGKFVVETTVSKRARVKK